jgi:hypothetical protein
MPTVDIPPVIVRLSGVTPAPMFWRILALVLDCILAGLVASIILTRVVLPQSHPDAEDTMRGELQAMNAELDRAQKTGATPQFTLNDDAQGIIEDTGKTFFLTLLLYFTISELATGGSTLGKRVFGLRAARWDTGERPGVMEVIFRNLFKAASLLPLGPVPVILLANVIPVFVRSTRRAGHDYLTRTMVTRDAPPPLPEDADHRHDDEE